MADTPRSAAPGGPAALPRGLTDAAEPIPATIQPGPVTVQVSPEGHVTITVQPAAAIMASDAALEGITAKGFGDLFGGGRPEGTDPGASQPGPFQQALDKLKGALDTLGAKIVEFTEEVTTLDVRTYVSERIEDVRPDGASGFEFAQQHAMTHIDFDGDTQVVVPVDAGQIDEALWKIHLQTVEAAQAHRAAMLKTIGELIQGFIPTLK